jgi:WD40 repeat protein
VAYAPDGRHILTAGADRTVRLWDVASGEEIHCYEGQGAKSGIGEVWSVAFSPDGRRFVSGSADHTVRLWQLPM